MNENKRSIYDIDPLLGESPVAKVVREANALPDEKRLKALSKLAEAMISNDAEKDLLEIFDYMERKVFDEDWKKEQETVSNLRPILKECAGIFDIKKTSFKQKDIVRFEGITTEGKNILSYLINNLDINAIEISTANGYSLEHEIKKGYDVLIQEVEVD